MAENYYLSALFGGILRRWAASPAMSILLRHGVAEEGIDFPYATFNLVGGAAALETFQSSVIIEEADVQFSIFDRNASPVTLLMHASLLTAKFHRATMDFATDRATMIQLTSQKVAPGILVEDKDHVLTFAETYTFTYRDTV